MSEATGTSKETTGTIKEAKVKAPMTEIQKNSMINKLSSDYARDYLRECKKGNHALATHIHSSYLTRLKELKDWPSC
jgi:hypothetical protein